MVLVKRLLLKLVVVKDVRYQSGAQHLCSYELQKDSSTSAVECLKKYNDGMIIGGILGLIFFLIIFGIDILQPQNIAWLMTNNNQDAIQHFVGWEFFRYEPWHFPLGLITNYGYPIPTSIVYTDSIPILALIFKCFSPWLSEDFQYFGFWFALCFFLQGFFSWALSSCITQNNTIKSCITLFFLLSPIMLNRLIEHQSLVAHWVILAGFWLYIRPYEKNINLHWLLLTTITVLIHAYLTLMVCLIWVAFLYKQVFIDLNISIYLAIRWIAINLCVMLIVAWFCGYFVVPLVHVTSAGGYNINAMNILAPFIPSTGATIVPGEWSLFVPQFQPKYLAQGDEGFNYLGIGMLMLCLISVCLLIRNPISFKKTLPWLPLLGVCMLSTIYALSNVIYIGQQVVFSYDLSKYAHDITNMFRASGRLFWPSYYFLMIFVFFILSKTMKSKLLVSVMLVALFIQLADLSIKISELHKLLSVTSIREDLPLWKNIKRRHSRIVFLPVIVRPDRKIAYFADYIHYAAKHNMSVNLGYFARQGHKEYVIASKALFQDVLHGHLSKDTLYIILDTRIAHILKSHLSAQDSIVSIGDYTVLFNDIG